MALKYKFEETEAIRSLLIKLDALKIVFERMKALPHIEENIRRESLLKSAVFSAKVEGNTLGVEKMKYESENEKTDNLQKTEIFNLLKAYRFVYGQKISKTLSLDLVKEMHQMAMKGVSSQAGKWRTESWAIFNQAGIAIYLAPPARELADLMNEYILAGEGIKYSIPVKAAIMQFLFEKIHPFADGNGRVGRLISSYCMNTGGYGFRGLVSIEEIIDKNREEYYRALEPLNNTASFVEFLLESFIEQAESVLEKFDEKDDELPEDDLLPRRREILEIIRDHPYCSFDFISRRFLAINPKTLHNDLKKLQEKGFIVKAGKTRGAVYHAKEGVRS